MNAFWSRRLELRPSLSGAVLFLWVVAWNFETPNVRAVEDKVRTCDAPTLYPGNWFYVGNRVPLTAKPLLKLPVGSIHPTGWLRQQLQYMADGFTGHLTEISKWCQFEGNAWSSPTGNGANGWEELPYWLKGFTDLAHVLHDPRLSAESKKWIDAIIAGQRADGYFGSEANRATPDIWPNMLVLCALRAHFEATADQRVPEFMTRYFRWLQALPVDKLLPGSWQQMRGGDNLDSIYWLYNRTGESWLLELATRNHRRTANWTAGIPTWHGVNISQGFREPAEYYQQSKELSDLLATIHDYHLVMNEYGQVPGGMFGADENARPGYTGPRQGAETCTMAEFMGSDEMLLGITGDRSWADRCEEVAFNSLPASMTPDLKGLHYLTAPNLIQCDRKSKSPMVENEGDMFSFNPHDYRCCQHNVAFGWPYFAEHLFMATGGNGLAATLYASCTVDARVGSGRDITITESSDYPFSDTIIFMLSSKHKVEFPFYLRVPGWCREPRVAVNGKQLPIAHDGQGWIRIDRRWKDGDSVTLTLPMRLAVKVWEKDRHAVSVSNGPLTYALKIGERWDRYGGTDAWPAFEVFPTTPWNYGLVVDPAHPEESLKVVQPVAPLPGQPFTPQTAPIFIRAKGKRIAEWKQESNGLVGEIQDSPVKSDAPAEEIQLIPMGCARLRISAFPQIGEGSDAHVWK